VGASNLECVCPLGFDAWNRPAPTPGFRSINFPGKKGAIPLTRGGILHTR